MIYFLGFVTQIKNLLTKGWGLLLRWRWLVTNMLYWVDRHRHKSMSSTPERSRTISNTEQDKLEKRCLALSFNWEKWTSLRVRDSRVQYENAHLVKTQQLKSTRTAHRSPQPRIQGLWGYSESLLSRPFLSSPFSLWHSSLEQTPQRAHPKHQKGEWI